MIRHAMILAAGRGERLRPLTDAMPKPLVQVGGKALIDHHLDRLRQAGFSRVVVNICHLADMMSEHMRTQSGKGMEIVLSRESEALETAGGIAKALPWLQDEPFLLISADIWTDVDIRPWCQKPWPEEAFGHLFMVPNPAHHAEGDFALTSDGRVRNKDEAHGKVGTYSGMAIFSPALCQEIKPGRAPLAPYLRDWARRGLLTGEWLPASWCDVGSPARLEEARQMCRRSKQ